LSQKKKKISVFRLLLEFSFPRFLAVFCLVLSCLVQGHFIQFERGCFLIRSICPCVVAREGEDDEKKPGLLHQTHPFFFQFYRLCNIRFHAFFLFFLQFGLDVFYLNNACYFNAFFLSSLPTFWLSLFVPFFFLSSHTLTTRRFIMCNVYMKSFS